MPQIELPVSEGYEPSTFIIKCSAQEVELVLLYGERLLKSHHILVKTIGNTNLANEQLYNLGEELKKAEETIQIQSNQRESDMTSATIALQDMKRYYEDILTKLKNDIAETDLKHKTQYNIGLNNEINYINEMRDKREKSIILRCEEDVDLLRIHMKNEIAVERARLSSEILRHQEQLVNTRLMVDSEVNRILTYERDRINQDKQMWLSELNLLHQKQVDSLTMHINQLQENMREKEQCLKDVGSIVKYYTYENNAVQGNKGENRIQELVKHYYKTCAIKDTSGIAHSGDMIMTLDALGVNCLIEVKNKKNIVEADIVKFLYDISEQKSKINCALFVSILSDNIPNKGGFNVEIRSGIPVIWIYMYDNTSIKFAMETLIFLNSVFSSNIGGTKVLESKELNADTISIIYNAFSTFQNESRRIDDVLKNLERQVSQLKLLQKNMNASINSITEYYGKYEKMKTKSLLISTYTTEELSRAKAWVVKEKKIPKRSQLPDILGCTEDSIKSRGVRSLQAIIKTYHCIL